MKRNITYKFFIAIGMAVVCSCSDDLLDNDGIAGKSQPISSLTSVAAEDAALTNEDVPVAFVNGIYSLMIQTRTGGSRGHDDFGHKAYDLFSDFLSGDMALSVSTYGWYRSSITEFQTPQDFTFYDNEQVWRYYYRIVRSANNVIENLGGNDVVPPLENNKYAMGQAKAMRAHSYFYLAQYFQKEYVGSEPILPLYIDPITKNLAKSTAEEVYAQMEKDLTEAISLLEGFNRTAKNQVNQDVAKMMLAYVLGAKGGRDVAVAQYTQEVIDAGNHTVLPSTEVTNGFNDVNVSSWVWGIDITENNSLGLVSWWGQVDARSYSYGWFGDYKVIDQSLFDAIPSDDVRKAQFYDSSSSGRHLQPFYKFYGSETWGGESSVTTADYVYMRIEEAYLLNAESNARAGNEVAARMSLKALVENRVPDASYIDGLSGQALLDEIYLQTRIELWGEGKSYLAMKRNKATITRGSNHLSFVGVPIPYNDERLTFEISQNELQNNPFINGQNQ